MSNDTIQPYHDWLNIPRSIAKPNYYQLLGMASKNFSDELLKTRFEERYRHIRRYEVGQYSELATRLLTELSQAYETLRDAKTRATYDITLRSVASESMGGTRPVRPDTVADPGKEKASLKGSPSKALQQDVVPSQSLPNDAAGTRRPARETSRELAPKSASPTSPRETLTGSTAGTVPVSETTPIEPTLVKDMEPLTPIILSPQEVIEPRPTPIAAPVDTPPASEAGSPLIGCVTILVLVLIVSLLFGFVSWLITGLLLTLFGFFCLLVGIIWFLAFAMKQIVDMSSTLGPSSRAKNVGGMLGGVSLVGAGLLLFLLGQWSWRSQSVEAERELAQREQVMLAIEEASQAIAQNQVTKAIALVDQVGSVANPTEQRVIGVIRSVAQTALNQSRREAAYADMRLLLIEGRAYLGRGEVERATTKLQEILRLPYAQENPDVVRFANEIASVHIQLAEGLLRDGFVKEARLYAEEALRVPAINIEKVAHWLLERVRQQELKPAL